MTQDFDLLARATELNDTLGPVTVLDVAKILYLHDSQYRTLDQQEHWEYEAPLYLGMATGYLMRLKKDKPL